MAWYLTVKTKNSGDHLISFDSEQDAKSALGRAQADWDKGPGGLTNIDDQVVVQRSDITGLTVHEAL